MTAENELISSQIDRAIGVLIASAAGDALGAGYEFGPPLPPSEKPGFRIGGLHCFGEAEWTDDTELSVCIAAVAAEEGIRTEAALDSIAQSFLDWGATWSRDVGAQTGAVLARATELEGSPSSRLSSAARRHFEGCARGAAGNGALMRTGPVGIAAIDNRLETAAAARRIAELTHADPLAGDSCVLWSEAIRCAVLTEWDSGEALALADLASGVDLLPEERRAFWLDAVETATGADPRRFGVKSVETGYSNGFTVGALQCAWAAITSVPVPRDDPAGGSFACQHLQLALEEAVRAGHDTDTVASVAGALLGARWGASAVPAQWRRRLYGRGPATGRQSHSELRSRELVTLAVLTARGNDDEVGWPSRPYVDYDLPLDGGVVHPADDGVVLGTARPATDNFDAVVSLCRVGCAEPWAAHVRPEDHVEIWLMDRPESSANPNLAFVIDDGARAVAAMRDEDQRVWLHCVAAHNRTPVVAARYGMLRGQSAAAAKRDVALALGLTSQPTATLWEAVDSYAVPEKGPLDEGGGDGGTGNGI